MRVAPKQTRHQFICLLECQSCGRFHVAYHPDGADRYPVAETECDWCGAWDADQVGPPIFTLN